MQTIETSPPPAGSFELTNVSRVILEEIENRKFTQAAIATTYALAIVSPETIAWDDVNQAIIARWSFRGLERIKAMAWANVASRQATMGN